MRKTRLFLSVLLVLQLAAGACSSETVPDEAQFTALMARLFKQALPQAEVVIRAPLALDITLADGPRGVHRSNLAAPYRLCVLHADKCDEIARMHAKDITTYYAHQGDQPDRATLRVGIRPRAFVDLLRARAPPDRLAASPLAGGLWIVAVIDQPTTTRPVKDSDLETLGLSPTEAIEAGRLNTQDELRSSIANLRRAAKTDRDMMGFAGNAYMASLLTFKDLWPSVAADLKAPVLAIAPAYDILIITRDDGPQAILALLSAAGDATRTALHPLPPTVLRWGDDGWTVAAP